jgi:hypothetical protein
MKRNHCNTLLQLFSKYDVCKHSDISQFRKVTGLESDGPESIPIRGGNYLRIVQWVERTLIGTEAFTVT